MAQWLSTLATLAEDLSPIPGTHRMVHRTFDSLFWPLQAHGAQTYMCMQNTRK